MNNEQSVPGKNIELHHESVNEIMGTPPSVMLRVGSGLLLTVFVGLFVASVFFNYPDVVQAPGVLVGEQPLSTQTAPEKGRIIEIYKNTGTYVNMGDTLLSIEQSDHQKIPVIAETTGLLELNPLISVKYAVQKEEVISFIWSEDVGHVACIVQLSPEQGKNVKEGNKLRMHLDKYPSDKYGTVESKIKSISHFNTGREIQIIAELPESIKTSTQFEFTPRGNIYASCEIITGEKSIFHRLINPFRSLAKND